MQRQETVGQLAKTRYDEYELDQLPLQLQRNSLDYYYLSVWPGLRDLRGIALSELPARPPVTKSAYIHLPFCSGLCEFCSYFVVVSKDADNDRRISTYLARILEEIDHYRELTEPALAYLYFGGGTPSVVHPNDFAALLEGLQSRGVLSQELLGTVEVHPELFNDAARAAEFLDVATSFGINRVSVGFQTIDGGLLHATNRRHTPDFLPTAIAMLRDRGMTINLDLMYGLPGITLDGWLASLQTALQYGPDSVSTYFTFVDYGTLLWKKVQANDAVLVPHADLQIQHIAAQVILEDAGFIELPNDFWSKPSGLPQEVYQQRSLPSAANSLGLGAGAYGYYPEVQYFNQFNLVSYATSLKNGQLPVWRAAALTEEQSLRRDIMFSFKNDPELSLQIFEAHYGTDPTLAFPDVFELLTDYGLVTIDHSAVRLTAKGRLIVEEIAALFAGPGVSARDRGSTSAEDLRIRKHHFASTYGRVSQVANGSS